jgi:hypothetical protein
MRLYLPIEELNLLLEPIPNVGEEEEENDYDHNDDSQIGLDQDNESQSNSSLSSEGSLIDVNEDSVESSHSGVENLEIFN